MGRRFNRIWRFLWESDSIESWIVDLILAFIIIRFVFFPVLGLIFSSPLPMVVVESGSMVHEGNFEEFWAANGFLYERAGVSKELFMQWKFKNGFNKGDIMVIKGAKEYKLGDIIVFKVQFQSTPIIHRIIETDGETFSTKGDHNSYQLPYEKKITKEQIIGKAVARIPAAGWLKLGLVETFKQIFAVFEKNSQR